MTTDKIIRSLEDQAQDKDRRSGGDPDSIFAEDAAMLTDAANLLKAYARTGLAPADIQEAVDILNDCIKPADLPAELKSWVERCTWHVRRCAELHDESASLIARNMQLQVELDAAKADIAALLWLDGQCEYCQFAKKESYSGAVRWGCKFGDSVACQPKWRGASAAQSSVPVNQDVTTGEGLEDKPPLPPDNEDRQKRDQYSQLRGLKEKLSDVLNYEPMDSSNDGETAIWEQANSLLSLLDGFLGGTV